LAQHDRTELETKEGRKAFNDKCSASIAETIANGGTRIEAIHTACAKAAATLPRKTKDHTANWFCMHDKSMMTAIGERNTAKRNHEQAPTAANKAKLREARRSVKDLTIRCKGAWVQYQAIGIQRINRGTSHAWECCKRICAGVDGQLAPRVHVTMRKPNGEVCDGSDEENAQCKGAYLKELFTKQSTATEASVNMIPQLPTNYDLGICPLDSEIHWAVQKLKRTGAGISGICAQDLQCMMSEQRTAQHIIDMVRAVWCTDDPIDESWYVGLTSAYQKRET
jgi:hypothetical protein